MSQIQESYAILLQVDKLLADIELRISNIEQKAPKIENTLATFKQLERVAIRYLAIVNRMGLPDDVQAVISNLARLISIIRMAQITMNLFYVASGPIGWAALGASAVMTGFATYDLLRGL